MTNEERKIIKARVGVLELARQLDNVSEACKIMGYSRDTFCRYKDQRAHQSLNRQTPWAVYRPKRSNRVRSSI